MKNLFNFSKTCAIITAVCFLTFGANVQGAINNDYERQYDRIFDNLSIIKQQYGKVTSFKDLNTDVTVINIQDLHCHPQTQNNISEIINAIDKQCFLKSIFVEGGYGNIDISWINKIKNADFKNKIAERLLQDGLLTGAEYYAIKNSKQNLLKGIDEKTLHTDNLSRLGKMIEKEPVYDKIISEVNQEISILNNRYVNEQNKRFSRLLEKYKNGKTDAAKFYKILFKYADRINDNLNEYNNIVPVSIDRYPNIKAYINIQKQSSEINARLAALQLQQLIVILKNKMPYNSYRKLLSATDNLSDTDKLSEFLSKFCEEIHFDLKTNFNELKKFLSARKLNQKINPVELMNEEKNLTEQIRMALSHNDTEYEITYITDFSDYFKNYLKYSLTSQDWEYCRPNLGKFRQIYSKYAAVDRIKTIENDFAEINEYYTVNSDRNDIFISNILNDTSVPYQYQTNSETTTPEKILKHSKEVVIVVTGGYHSTDLQNILSAKNVNSIVITPNISTDTSQANERYKNIIKEQNKIFAQALAFRLASSSGDIEQKFLLAKAAVELLNGNIDRINALLEDEIKVSKNSEGNVIANISGNEFTIDLKRQLTESEQIKKNKIKDVVLVSTKHLPDIIPSKGLQSLFNPNFYDSAKNLSLQLFRLGFYFSNGSIFEIAESKYNEKDIDGIPPEIYSTFLPEVQMMLLERQGTSVFNKVKEKESFIKEIRRYFSLRAYSSGKDDNRYVKNNIFTPAIDNIWRCIAYKICVNLFERFFVSLLRTFSKEKKRLNPYLEILINANNRNVLIYMAGNDKFKIKYRLFALMYLKKNGFKIPKETVDAIRQKFIDEVKSENFHVTSNFDLRALTSGVFLSLDDFTQNLISRDEELAIYKKISRAVIVKKGKKRTAANAAMYFVSFDTLTIAHELGHNILLKARKFHSSNKEESTIHELFAEVVANIFADKINTEKIDRNAILYDLSNDVFDYQYIFQEEHNAARGFINLVSYTSESIHQNVNWTLLAKIILNYVTRNKNVKQQQAQVFNYIIKRYFDKIAAFNPQVTTDKINEILKTGNSYSIVYYVLSEIKQISHKRFSAVIKRIKNTVLHQESYIYGKKSKLDYEDDFVVINNIVLSQPDKIYDILNIIKEELLKKQRFSRSEMEMLISIELLLKSDVHSVSKDVFIKQLVKYARLLPEKETFSKHDFQKIYAYLPAYNDKSPVLTMTWLNNLLVNIGIKNYETRQKIIVSLECPITILGIFFPKIRKWFIKKHTEYEYGDVDKKLQNLELQTKKTITEIFKLSFKESEDLYLLSFINKIRIVSKILLTKYGKEIRKNNKEKHRQLNEDLESGQKIISKPKNLKRILILSIAADLLITVLMKFSPLSFIFMIFPVTSLLTLLWSLLPSRSDKIYHKQEYETEYFSNIPETDYDYSKGNAPGVTVQIPVYTESNEIIFNTILQSVKACEKYRNKSGASANVLISDDGLAVLLDGNISGEHLEELLKKSNDEISENERKAVERIKFYRKNNISFIARPKEKRAGLFKKASNLNHTYETIGAIASLRPIPDGTYCEGADLYINDIILLLDKDSLLNEDVISVTIPKFIKDDKLAFTQNSTIPSNHNDNYFTKFLSPFTSFLYKHIFSVNAVSGGLVPFVGHNGFIRKSALEDIGNWPENRVSEDFYTSTQFATAGYHGKYLSFKNYEFQEMVSRSYIEEVSKIERYVFGLLELIFNKPKSGDKGLTNWMKDFLKSENIRWYQKINFFVYPLSYLNIASTIPAVLTALMLGIAAAPQFSYFYLIASAPFFIVLYKIYKDDGNISEKEKKPPMIILNVAKNILLISFMFISFSYPILKGIYKFIFKPNSKFSPTNVDKENYTFKQAVQVLKDYFNKNKSMFLTIIPLTLIVIAKKPVFGVGFATSLFYLFASFFAALLLNPFLITSAKVFIQEKLKIIKENIFIKFELYKFSDQDGPEQEDKKYVSVFLVNNFDMLKNKYPFVNTGLKVDGKIVWQIDTGGALLYGAENADPIKIAKAVNKSKILKKHLKKTLRLKDSINLNIEGSVIIDESSDDIYFENGLIISNANSYAKSIEEIFKSISVMYSQKTIISLENVQDDKLYQALTCGTARKTITLAQFEYLKETFESHNADILSEILKLREKGIEIYIKCEEKNNIYSDYGVSGQIIGANIYDYCTDEETEIEIIEENTSLKSLENKIINSDKPLLVDIKILQNIFRTSKDIIETYNLFESLIGNIKIKFGLKNIRTKDVLNFAYSIDIGNIPEINENDKQKMLMADIFDFTNTIGLDKTNVISIILNDTRMDDTAKNIFLSAVKERVLAKTELKKHGKEFGLKNKRLEILLGKLLVMQQSADDKKSLLDEINNFKGTQEDMIKKVNELLSQQKADKNKESLAVNTMIELILVYAEEFKTLDKTKRASIDVSGYRQMLAAA